MSSHPFPTIHSMRTAILSYHVPHHSQIRQCHFFSHSQNRQRHLSYFIQSIHSIGSAIIFLHHLLHEQRPFLTSFTVSAASFFSHDSQYEQRRFLTSFTVSAMSFFSHDSQYEQRHFPAVLRSGLSRINHDGERERCTMGTKSMITTRSIYRHEPLSLGLGSE